MDPKESTGMETEQLKNIIICEKDQLLAAVRSKYWEPDPHQSAIVRMSNGVIYQQDALLIMALAKLVGLELRLADPDLIGINDDE